MSNQTIKDNNLKKEYVNDTDERNIINDLEYQYLMMGTLMKYIISVIIFVLILIIKYFKIYHYFFNEQNTKFILKLNCFSGGIFFFLSFIFATNKEFFIKYKKDQILFNNNNINNLEILGFVFGFIFIFFIKRILTESVSFYIPLEITQIEKEKEKKICEESNNNIQNINQSIIISEANESEQISFNNLPENIIETNKHNSFHHKRKNIIYHNIEMSILEKNENDLEFKKEEHKKINNSSNNNFHIQGQNNYIFNRPFKDADNDEETNEEFYLSSHEKEVKKIASKKKTFFRSKAMQINQIPNFNLNPLKVKKNEKVKEENIHKLGTKINKEVFDITYKSEKDMENKTITINLFNKKLLFLIIIAFLYNIYILFIGIAIGFLELKQNLLMFCLLVFLMFFRVLYEKNNILYNNDLFKNESIIQKIIFIIFDLSLPLGISLGNQLINLYYKTYSYYFCYFIILINGICSGNLLFFGTFLLYFEESKNNNEIQKKFLFFSLGIFSSFIISLYYN